jgi:hypothetical protein
VIRNPEQASKLAGIIARIAFARVPHRRAFPRETGTLSI